MADGSAGREGSLEAPTRHTIDWKSLDFHDEQSLHTELERVFDICHGCRRCFSLCNAFPTLFDLVDESDTGELDSVDRRSFSEVVDHCFLCDLCFMTKCPYVPPHEFNIDFPHLMLRAKSAKFERGEVRRRDRFLSATDAVGRLASIPIVVEGVNAANRSKLGRGLIEKTLGVHSQAPLPTYHNNTLRKRLKGHRPAELPAVTTSLTRGRVALFTTCYGNYNEPETGEDLIAVFEHNGIPVRLVDRERCCGMPKLELGDLESVQRAKQENIPALAKLIDDGWDIVAPIPSCVLMFKQELPLLFADDPDVAKVQEAIFDPFEYLMARDKDGELNKDFKRSLGKIAYHVACHQRVQNIGLKTAELFRLIPDTTVEPVQRCSGHDGTYAVKAEYHDISMKLGAPVARQIERAAADYYCSDCPMAARQIEAGLTAKRTPASPWRLMRIAYGLT